MSDEGTAASIITAYIPDHTKWDSTLRSLRPLNQAELQRIREEFVIETTYNSNAIEGNTLTLRETALILQEGITIAEKPLRDHLDMQQKNTDRQPA